MRNVEPINVTLSPSNGGNPEPVNASVNLSTFRCPVNDSIDQLSKGIKFNPGWGMLDGKPFSWRKNFYHKPMAFVNHYWNYSN